MSIQSLSTPGLGDATYLLTHGDRSILIDPQRDVDRFLTAAPPEAPIGHVLETHLHNDYLSGAREIAERTGAALILPAAAGAAYDHQPAFHLEDIPAGPGLTIRPIHTPGHTPEHTSYLILIDGEPAALFSGGSLLVGSAGRPDLLGPARARQLAKLQFGSLRRLAALPEPTGLYPTHGAGSFCTSSLAAGRALSTIGDERRQNPLLRHADPEAFADAVLADLAPYPAYYARMGPANLLGVAPWPRRAVPELTPDQLAGLAPTVAAIDGRPRTAFAAGHRPGSLGIELGDQFSAWVGWIVPGDTPIALVLDPDQDAGDAIAQLARIGYDDVRGILRGSDAWHAAGRPVAAYPTIDPAGLARAIREGSARQILDVRTPAEWAAGHLPGSVHRFVPDLVHDRPAELDPAEPVYVACGSGYRATIAASLLERAGYRPIVLIGGGVPDVREQLAVPAGSGAGR